MSLFYIENRLLSPVAAQELGQGWRWVGTAELAVAGLCFPISHLFQGEQLLEKCDSQFQATPHPYAGHILLPSFFSFPSFSPTPWGLSGYPVQPNLTVKTSYLEVATKGSLACVCTLVKWMPWLMFGFLRRTCVMVQIGKRTVCLCLFLCSSYHAYSTFSSLPIVLTMLFQYDCGG